MARLATVTPIPTATPLPLRVAQVGNAGGIVTLTNGSTWAVVNFGYYYTRNWQPGQAVGFLRWTGSAPWPLKNYATGDVVDVVLP